MTGDPGVVPPTLYEWKRPDGTVLKTLVWLETAGPAAWLWPFDSVYGPGPSGPVRIWRTRPGGEPELAGETEDGPAGLTLYVDGRAVPFRDPDEPPYVPPRPPGQLRRVVRRVVGLRLVHKDRL